MVASHDAEFVVYVKKTTDGELRRNVYTPSEKVDAEYDGFVQEKPATGKAGKANTGSSENAANNAG